MKQNSGLQRAIEIAGNQNKLADAIGVRQSLVSYWVTNAKHGVPPQYCPKIEAATGVPLYELRPDVFPAPTAQAAE